MDYSPLAVANAFYDRALAAGDAITHMKMQKLVYISHGWTLGIADEPLIPDDVKAWKYGPVIERLWHELKSLGHQPMTQPASIATIEGGKIRIKTPMIARDDEWTTALIDQIWRVYGTMSATQLSRLTHQEGSPWHTVAKAFNFNLPKNVVIPRELIRAHYRQKWQQSQSAQHTAP